MADGPELETRYARNGDVSLAYQVVGTGPVDAVFIPGFASHVDLNWEVQYGRLFERLRRSCRLVVMDKRGTGLSDRFLGVATLEDRMDDVRAVMDAAGMERATLLGFSEGAALAILMAASKPERVNGLAVYGGYAHGSRAPDYPIGTDTSNWHRYLDFIERSWGTGHVLDVFMSHPPDPDLARRELARYERYSTTPSVARDIMDRGMQIDVRPALAAIGVPVLVVHCRNDPVVPVSLGRYLAAHLRNARLVELEGEFHLSWLRHEVDAIVDPIEEFLTGVPPEPDEPERLLTTVLFTDIVGSTARAVELGDRTWRTVLDRHDALVRDELNRHRGRAVNTAGDGFLAAFDGPARAIRCATTLCERVRDLGLEIRAGIHTGECERRGDDLAGIGVHIGARVTARAAPSEVLVSSTVRDLVVGSGVKFADRGRHTLKGVPGRWQLLAVEPESSDRGDPSHN